MKKIAFIGGDKRNYLLSEMFENEGKIFKFGFDDYDNESLKKCLNSCEYIIFPVPFSKDGVNLYAPTSNKEIKIENCIKGIEGKTIFVGKIEDEILKSLQKKGNVIIDFNKNPEFIKNNAIPTAEGIINIIIENTDITIDNSNILVLGFGNVGKYTAKLLKGLNARVFCYDIKKQEVANIKSCGYNVLEEFNNYIEKIDVIVNTVPALVLDEDKFKYINKNTLIIDVASKPGGVDFEYAKRNGYKVIHALGIPGKIAPRTAATYMKNIIEKYII
ncbi:MAG: dipicolinate synthase subunit DpsA [Clostridia bacterium]|nr:dipicolinate synthase subunit DpsA [Clostridia bacterium]